MPVVLRQSADLPGEGSFERWCAAGNAAAGPDGSPKVEDLAGRLEKAFEAIRDRWWKLGRLLSATPSAELAHMPACGADSSDFGVMLAWTRLVDALAVETPCTLVICDDPWLFRHLAGRSGVSAGTPPGLWMKTMTLRLRGFLARCRAAARLVVAALARPAQGTGGTVLIVYGHPDSGAATDAYFGGLIQEMPELERLAHTDCAAARALELSIASLHAWGVPSKALGLPFARWRLSSQDLSHPEGWLIRRAAEVEGGGGSAAMNRWQFDCQEAWLAATRPRCVAWPWENHPWERALVRAARKRRIHTVGHQHTVVGPHMFNYSPASNVDGLDSFPDVILCNGPAYRRNLMDWGVPEDRLAIGGALRQAGPRPLAHDPGGPVFVALSSNRIFSEQMLAAMESLEGPWRFLVKEHPMYPHPFAETEKVGRTKTPLQDQDGLAGVLYSTGTVGLEALLGGLPTLRFRPEGAVALDILPPGLEARLVEAGTLAEALKVLDKPQPLAWNAVLAPPDFEAWKQALCPPDGGSP